MKLASLNPYWVYIKVGAALLVCGLMFGWGYHTANLAGRLALESERRQVAEDARLQIEAAQKQAYDADERYRKAQQKIPQTGQKVADAVREHPSSPDCVVPDAAADALQDGIDAGKASAG
jgi:hypothetical protein